MLIVAFSTFFVVKKHNLERVMTEVALKTESQCKYWNQEMSVILLHYDDCRYSKIYSPESYGLGFPGTYLDIIQDLRDKEGVLPFVDKLYFYNMDEEKIFSSEEPMRMNFSFRADAGWTKGFWKKQRNAAWLRERRLFIRGRGTGL